MRRAAALTAEQAAQSKEEVDEVCAAILWARKTSQLVTDKSSFANRSPLPSQAFLAPRPRDARALSAARDVEAKTRVDEALNFYFKAKGKDGAQKRRELLNMRPGDRRRRLEPWQERAEEVQRLQDKKGARRGSSPEDRRGGLRERTREEFEKEFVRMMMRNKKSR